MNILKYLALALFLTGCTNIEIYDNSGSVATEISKNKPVQEQ